MKHSSPCFPSHFIRLLPPFLCLNNLLYTSSLSTVFPLTHALAQLDFSGLYRIPNKLLHKSISAGDNGMVHLPIHSASSILYSVIFHFPSPFMITHTIALIVYLSKAGNEIDLISDKFPKINGLGDSLTDLYVCIQFIFIYT